MIGTAGLNRAPKRITVDSTNRIAAPIDVQNVNTNAPLTFGDAFANDGDWQHVGGANEFVFNGTADVIEVKVSVHQKIPDSASSQRPSPVLELYRNDDAVPVASSSTGYIRDASDHEESSNLIVFVDPDPSTLARYRVQARRDTGIDGAVDAVTGQFSAVATTRRSVTGAN